MVMEGIVSDAKRKGNALMTCQSKGSRLLLNNLKQTDEKDSIRAKLKLEYVRFL